MAMQVLLSVWLLLWYAIGLDLLQVLPACAMEADITHVLRFLELPALLIH